MGIDMDAIAWQPSIPPEKSKNYEGFRPSVVELPVGHKRNYESRPLQAPMILERDQALLLRDGTRIYADIYRPMHNVKIPAILAWGPYGKSGSGLLNLDMMPLRAGVPKSRLSGYENFEGPDPAEWIPRGYAVVNVDIRGVGDSEGNMMWFGRSDGQDGYDAIEEIAKLPWCNGRVAMVGNSWLAISQWFIAAERPPHLACIAPLEGASDMMREQFCRGGVPNIQFAAELSKFICGRNMSEDLVAMQKRFPFANPYWDDKRAVIERIQVPAYILASYSSSLHTVGSFRGYEDIPHANKWLVIHDTQEWYDLYTSARIEDLTKFLDHYTKDTKNDWKRTPPVRATVLGFNQPAVTGIAFSEPNWPCKKTTVRKLYLNSGSILSDYQPEIVGQEAYQADSAPVMQFGDDRGELTFIHVFSQKTVLLGPSRAVLYIMATEQNDLDVYVQLRKGDAQGKQLVNLNIPLADLGVTSVDEVPLVNPLLYLGPEGFLRASNRAVIEEWSRPHWKTLAHTTSIPIASGEPVRLEIDIWPTGMVFEAGEQLQMKVSGHSMGLVDFENLHGSFTVQNEGKHILFWGGSTMSFVEIPVVELF